MQARIKYIDAIALEMPLKKQWKISLYQATTRSHAVVRITTEDGVTGYGEVAPSPAFMGETGHTVALIVNNYYAPALEGQDSFAIESLHNQMECVIHGNQAARSAVDMALYDIIGKMLGRPVYDLIGGRYRDRVALSWVVGIQNMEGAVEEAKWAMESGYRVLKLKVGLSPEADYKLVSAVRKALGDNVVIRLDANQGYDFRTACTLFQRLEEFNLESIEQPVKRWDIAGMAALKQKLKTTIMADESVSTPHDALRIVEAQAADCVNIKVGKVGGLWESKKIASVLEAGGLTATAGSNLEVGIGSAASIHFVASSRIVDMPNDLLLGGPLHEYDLIKEDFIVEAGEVLVPSSPGLGIEVDESLFK